MQAVQLYCMQPMTFPWGPTELHQTGMTGGLNPWGTCIHRMEAQSSQRTTMSVCCFVDASIQCIHGSHMLKRCKPQAIVKSDSTFEKVSAAAPLTDAMSFYPKGMSIADCNVEDRSHHQNHCILPVPCVQRWPLWRIMRGMSVFIPGSGAVPCNAQKNLGKALHCQGAAVFVAVPVHGLQVCNWAQALHPADKTGLKHSLWHKDDAPVASA